MDLRRCFATLRACDFFDLSVFLHTQPDVLNLLHKAVILRGWDFLISLKSEMERSPRPQQPPCPLTKVLSLGNGPFPLTTLPFVIGSAAEGSAVPRASRGNAEYDSQREFAFPAMNPAGELKEE
jgi:hypothetical protein